MDGHEYPSLEELDTALHSKRTSSRIVIDEVCEDNIEKKLRETKMTLKFLVNNNSAGFLIGKGGSTIAELQSCTKARINIALSGEFYPGTLDRAVLISGTYEKRTEKDVYSLHLL